MTDRPLPKLEDGPTRLQTLTHKIDGADTGFKGAVYLHVDYDPKTKKIHGLRLAEPRKDGSALDRLLNIIGDRATSSVRSIQAGGE